MGFMDQAKDAARQAQQAQAGGAAGMPGPEEMAYMNKVTKLNNSGIESPATIKSMKKTGKQDVGGGIEYEVEVDVKPADGDPYSATFLQYMHEPTMGSWATEGADVKVRVDPDDSSSMILWGGAG